MYTRVVSFTVLPDLCELTRDVIHHEVTPVLLEQPGLVDCVILQSSDEPTQFLGITFWVGRDHAEHYHSSVYLKLIERLKPYIDGNADVRFFTVDTSTFHHIEAGRLAP
jgi:quinol monooxygenase YgiN